jgi:predicted ATPase/DNA-binding SARP family transcriptional activator
MSSQGQLLTLARRQARALLYRIVVSPREVSRDQLCSLIWPDVPQSTARRNLTVLLTQLRQALPRPDILLTTDDAIQLNSRAAWSDTIAFAKATEGALHERRSALLSDAVNLYRGPFLHGFTLPSSAEYEEWASQERQVWERRYLDTLATLVEAQAEAGDLPAAIDYAQRYLATDDLAEDVHRRLIELYAAAGDRVAAMRQFERCVVVLERELGVSPLPETRAAYEAARGGEMKTEHGTRKSNHSEIPQSLSRYPLPHARLPASPSPLIGRAEEVAAAAALLCNPGVRLLTLSGAGGSGKTRLALQVACDVQRCFADGVVFVTLAPLREADMVIHAIAEACGIRETGTTPADVVRAYLRDKRMLLVLDNFEHLLGAASTVANLLAAAPGLRVLVTTRTVLNLSGEHIFAVPPLPLPELGRLPAPAELAKQPAVALLLDRTRAHTPSFRISGANAADIATICVHLDGLPLAIELAAARLKVLSPQALLRRLDHRLALLDRGPRDLPDRQRTLRATVDWSYQLLGQHTRRLFERLAVFEGGWTLAAAEEICCAGDLPEQALDDIQALLDSHLLVPGSGSDDGARFGMLETIREYALERLRNHNDEWLLRRRHAIYFCDLAERRAPSMYSADISTADRDYHNMRAALQWSIEAGEHEIAARIACSLFWYWDTRGLLAEGRSWNAQVRRLESALPHLLQARLAAQAGYLAYRCGELNEAARLAANVHADIQAAAIDRELALRVAGLAALEAHDMRSARQYFEQALAFAQAQGLLRDVAGAQFNLGILLLIQGEIVEAEAIFRASYRYWEQQQHPRYTGVALATLGYIAVLRGKPDQAAALLRDGLQQLLLGQDLTYVLYVLLACCGLATVRQQPLPAAVLFGAATRQAEHVGLRFIAGLWHLIQVHVEQARRQSAAEEFNRALQHGQSLSVDEAIALAQALLASTHSAQLE